MIVFIVGDNVELIKNIFDVKAIITSFGDIGYLPTRKEIKNRKINGIIIKAVTDISCDAILSLIFNLNMLLAAFVSRILLVLKSLIYLKLGHLSDCNDKI